MPVLQTNDLKQRAGEILEASKVEPQFIFRAGQLYMLAPVEPGPGVRNLPDGHFADAYPQADERLEAEAAFANVRQTIQR